jgi:glucose-1-phosphatase
MQIRAVFFDLGKVILNFNHQDLVDRLLSKRNDADSVRPAFFEFLFDDTDGLCNLYDAGAVSSAEFYAKMDARFPLGYPYALFVELWNGIFTERLDVSELMRRVRRKRPVYLLSNVNELHWEHAVERFPVLSEMDGWVLSYKVRARKPDREIFDAALRLSGAPPEETLFIDDLEANTASAAGLGIKAITFTGADQLESELIDLSLI